FLQQWPHQRGEILKIRNERGNYVLPLRIVSQVLLRMDRRFYDGDKSHVINLFQASNSDAVPDHFVRLAKLVLLGHDASRVHEELLYLLKKACVLAEHQRLDELSEDDLICLSPG